MCVCVCARVYRVFVRATRRARRGIFFSSIENQDQTELGRFENSEV